MARFFVPKENIHDNYGTIAGEELDHLKRVLRLGRGDHITVFDDGGWEHEAVVRSFGAGEGLIEILRSYQTARESPLEITVAVGLTKGEKMDFVVEKATELGVQTIVPFVSAYTVPKLDDGKIEKRRGRWQKIALSATKQSGRTRVPAIVALSGFRDLVREPRSGTLKLLFWEKEGPQKLREVYEEQKDARRILAIVGPEGGFSAEEAKLAIDHGFRPVHLGHRILRAETAVVAAMSLVQFLWGDLG